MTASKWNAGDHNKFTIITNGTLINNNMAKFFKKYNVRLQVTIDGDEKCHNAQGKSKNEKGTWGKIIKNVHILQKYNTDYNIRCTVTNNSPALSEIIKKFKENKINNVFLSLSPRTV